MTSSGFEVFGPFNVPVRPDGTLDASRAAIEAFWHEVEGRQPGLSRACGCFVLSVLHGADSLPWHVGIAADKSFFDNCFNPDNIEHCRAALTRAPLGTPHTHLIAVMTPTHRLARPGVRQRTEIQLLERVIVGFAMNRNPLLSTEATGSYTRHSSVAELLAGIGGKSTLDQRAFRRLLGLSLP